MNDVSMLRTAPPRLFSKTIVSEGCGFNTPQTGSICKIKVTLDKANLLSGLEKQIKVITVGDSDNPTDEILEDCIRTMKESEESIMVFSHNNSEPEVVCNTKSIQFQLISYTGQREIWEMSVEEKWKNASYHKQRGLNLYTCKEYEYAFRHFGLALKYILCLEPDAVTNPENTEIKAFKLALYLNLAACQLKHKNFECVVVNSTKALKMQLNDVKALYRRGSAYVQLQEYEKAKEDLIAAKKLEPNNRAVAKQLKELKIRVQKLNQYYADAMKKMFS